MDTMRRPVEKATKRFWIAVGAVPVLLAVAVAASPTSTHSSAFFNAVALAYWLLSVAFVLHAHRARQPRPSVLSAVALAVGLAGALFLAFSVTSMAAFILVSAGWL